VSELLRTTILPGGSSPCQAAEGCLHTIVLLGADGSGLHCKSMSTAFVSRLRFATQLQPLLSLELLCLCRLATHLCVAVVGCQATAAEICTPQVVCCSTPTPDLACVCPCTHLIQQAILLEPAAAPGTCCCYCCVAASQAVAEPLAWLLYSL
jgi:hypothetical protein